MKHYGEDHAKNATTLGNLAGALNNLGDYETAKKYYQKALEIDKKHYGEDHVKYAITLGNLSIFLANMGDYNEAKEGY
jgi:tetratricopeptide (TPR) repeat protein